MVFKMSIAVAAAIEKRTLMTQRQFVHQNLMSISGGPLRFAYSKHFYNSFRWKIVFLSLKFGINNSGVNICLFPAQKMQRGKTTNVFAPETMSVPPCSSICEFNERQLCVLATVFRLRLFTNDEQPKWHLNAAELDGRFGMNEIFWFFSLTDGWMRWKWTRPQCQWRWPDQRMTAACNIGD